MRLGLGQRPPVELAAGRQRQGLQFHKRRRDHVGRQLPLEKAAPIVGAPLRSLHQIGHQLPLARRILAHHDNRILYLGVTIQDDFDFARLDAKAPNLDLIIHPADEFDVPIG